MAGICTDCRRQRRITCSDVARKDFPLDHLTLRALAIDLTKRLKPTDHGIEIIFYLKHIEINPWLVHWARGPQLDPTARLWMERPNSNGKAIDRPSSDCWE